MRTFAILGAALSGLLPGAPGQAASDLEAPVRLKAGEAFVDTGPHGGHSGPLLCDYDGDGRADLLVGNQKGHIQVYRNTGTESEPAFEDAGLLQAGGEDAHIPNWWSVGLTPRLADLDGDGRTDLLTGCFDGGSYLFRGREEGGFAAPEPVLDGTGSVLRVGRYWDDEGRRWVGMDESLGISATPVDQDGDGDPDLLLGTAEGTVFLSRNEGTATEPAFSPELTRLEAGGRVLQVPGGYAVPVLADWDGDGLWDLVTGSSIGAVYWFRNEGEPGAPRFAAAVQLVPRPTGKEDEPGRRTQVAVADFDADGDMDLLVGDYRAVQSETAKDGRACRGWVWLYRRKSDTSKAEGEGR